MASSLSANHAFYDFPCPPITDEEFKAFHATDRGLFSRLIGELGRDPKESMKVMGFWMWLEEVSKDRLMMKRVLSLPFVLVNELVEETLLCLKFVQSDKFPNCPNLSGFTRNDLVLMPTLVGFDSISLRFFFENRVGVVCGVTKMVNEICVRAFEDITSMKCGHFPEYPQVQRAFLGGNSNYSCDDNVRINPTPRVFSGTLTSSNNRVEYLPMFGVVERRRSDPGVRRNEFDLSQRRSFDGPNHLNTVIKSEREVQVNYYNLEANSRQILKNEHGSCNDQRSERFRSDGHKLTKEEEEEVAADERTIFLTFSKGYPISENEVQEFFTRKFGDIVEAIYMQEVPPETQVLFARLVARSASDVDTVVVDGGKTKFSINGKHVWARKYIKKLHPKLPPRMSAAPSSSPSTV